MFYRVITRENGHKMIKKVTFYRAITRENVLKLNVLDQKGSFLVLFTRQI